jgi:hypothetical protein
MRDSEISKRVQLLAVVTSFGETEERARLTRGTLDLLGLSLVPVCYGKHTVNIPSTCNINLTESYIPNEGEYIKIEAIGYMKGLLQRSEDKSIDLCLIACHTDCAQLMKESEDLCKRKLRSVGIMGGVKPGLDKSGFMEPDESYNLMCDKESARFVYSFCQTHKIKMVFLSRWTAYACTIPRSFYDEFSVTGHPVAIRMVSEQRRTLSDLKFRACAPIGSKEREELPGRCDKSWFCRIFLGGDDFKENEDIWTKVKGFMMYDPLLCVALVDELREAFFQPEVVEVNGVRHEIIGISEEKPGFKEGLVERVRSFMLESFKNGIALPPLPFMLE